MAKIKCKHCGYTWNYKGSKNGAVCPKCRKWMTIKKPVDAKKRSAKTQVQEKPLTSDILDNLNKEIDPDMDKAFVRDSILHILGDDLALRLARASQKKKKNTVTIMRGAVKQWLDQEGF